MTDLLFYDYFLNIDFAGMWLYVMDKGEQAIS